jgi:hypothetical protein
MRIYDEDNQKVINNVSIFLTVDEAQEIWDSLEDLLNKFQNDADHAHINDADYSHEITFCLYNENNLNSFNTRAKKIIRDNG